MQITPETFPYSFSESGSILKISGQPDKPVGEERDAVVVNTVERESSTEESATVVNTVERESSTEESAKVNTKRNVVQIDDDVPLPTPPYISYRGSLLHLPLS